VGFAVPRALRLGIDASMSIKMSIRSLMLPDADGPGTKPAL
jgi:hypothetical protein